MDKSKRMNVYFISGLGADRKAFERLRLPAHCSIHHLDWIPPGKGESLNSYAKRLSAAINTTQPFAVVGLSMGGMLAATMTRFLPPHKTVLISSIACNKEFPPLLKFSRLTRLHYLLPLFLLRRPNFAAYWLFGAKTRGERRLLHYLISNSDPRFIRWAIGAIVSWQDCERPGFVYQIHGDSDRMLPAGYTKPDVIIKKGSHFMVWTKAGEVSRILAEVLKVSGRFERPDT
jgi:pimeloyl-ACP methyl ester carboxylesterase